MNRLFAFVPLAIVAVGCGPDVVLSYRTEIRPDGMVARRIEARGVAGAPSRDPRPKDAPALLDAEIAQPEAWRDVRRSATSIEVEGVFPSSEEVPPAFALGPPDRRVRENSRLAVAVDDLVVLDRYVYRETYADPYGPGQVDAALDDLVDLAWRVIAEEIRREFGDGVDVSRAEALARGPARDILGRIAAAMLRDRGRPVVVAELQKRGLPVSHAPDDEFGDDQLLLLSRVARERVAVALSTPSRTITAEELRFWPIENDGLWPRIEELLARGEGGKEAMEATTRAALDALLGFFAGAGGNYRFRFEVIMPGRMFRANGALDEEGAGWFFRGDDVTATGRSMEAESIVLDDDALKRLSARRPESAAALAEIVDALTIRDPDGLLRALLAEAVEQRNLKLLRNTPEGWKGPAQIARQLADLLS